MIDCEELPGRLQDICRGTAVKANGRRHSLSARKKIVSARLQLPISEIELPFCDDATACEKEPVEPVGTFMKANIEKLFTIRTGQDCGCQNLATQMDLWGIDGCEKRREEIVAHLVSNRDILTGSLARSVFSFVREAGVKDAAAMAVKLAGDWWHSKDVTREAEIAGAHWLLDMAIAGARAAAPPRKHPVIPQRGLVYSCRVPITTIRPRPFPGLPTLTLLCHCWPNGDNWRNHVEYLKRVEGRGSRVEGRTGEVFGRKIMGVATGPKRAGFDEVRRAFGDSWEYVAVENDPKLREVKTYQPMLDMVQSTNENDVTFCIHTKGTQAHTSENPQIKWWTGALYETVVYNWQSVLAEMGKGYSIVGSFRRINGHFRTRYGWHFSGTFYAFRNAAAFPQGMPAFEHKWWGTESWPGNHFSREEASCLFADNCGHLYDSNPALEAELVEWRSRKNAT